MLRDMCCDFWNLDSTKFSLYDHNFGHLMALNAETNHQVHRVTQYFEVLKMRYPLLYMLEDNIEKQALDDEQRRSARIQTQNPLAKLNQNTNNIILDNAKQRAQKAKQMQQQNMTNFIKKFPGQRKFEIPKKKNKKRPSSALDPDTFFYTFCTNICLILVTLLAIFTQRNFPEEYFIRQNILTVFSQDQINQIVALNEETVIANQTWGEMIPIAMQPNFTESELYVSEISFS